MPAGLRRGAILVAARVRANMVASAAVLQGVHMHVYVYDASGKPMGTVCGNFIHDMQGYAIGQLRDTHVYRINGAYVGELYKGMVVNKHLGQLRNIGSPADPGNPGQPVHPGNRGVINVGYPDVFEQLLQR
jgi:hypothetical protein